MPIVIINIAVKAINLIYKIIYFKDRLIRLETGRTDGYLADASITK